MKVHPLKKLCAKKIKVEFKPIAERSNGKEWPSTGAQHFLATIRYKKRELQTEYTIGSAVVRPEAADLVHCLLNDASAGQDSFEDFCSSFGYDTDSRKAHATWLACQTAARDIKFLLGDDLEMFQEAAVDY